MKLYDAIMKAADHIERNPQLFNFDAIRIPNCGTPGCALGWIGFMANIQAVRTYDGVALVAGAGSNYVEDSLMPTVSAREFYSRMDRLVGGGWMDDARLCATGMRRYAEKYHGHEKPKAPDWNAMASKWTVGDDVKSQELVS